MPDIIQVDGSVEVVTVGVPSATISIDPQPATTLTVDADTYTVVTTDQPVVVLTAGAQGPPGPPGPPSPGETFIFNQGTPATTWTINHGLGQFPSVTVVDSGGSVVIGAVDYIDSNSLTVSFTMAFGGKAYLN